MKLPIDFDFKRTGLNSWALFYQNKETDHKVTYNGKVYVYSFDKDVFAASTLELAQLGLVMDYLEYHQDD